MPYIAIKAYQKDGETKKRVVKQINEIFLKEWGCPPEAISISVEEYSPADWKKQVKEDIILQNQNKMMILEGKEQI